MTALSSITDMTHWVEMFAPGAPDNLVTDAIKRAVRRFCIMSETLTEEITVTTVADQAAYTLTPVTADVQVHRVSAVRYSTSDDDEPKESYYYDMALGKLTFKTDYVPSAASLSVIATCILRPEWKAETFPTWMLERYGERIADGAAAEICGLPSKDFGNPKLAEVLEAKFRDVVNEATAERMREGTSRSWEIDA